MAAAPVALLVAGASTGMDSLMQLVRCRVQVNKAECANLIDRWTSKECADAITAFMMRKAPR